MWWSRTQEQLSLIFPYSLCILLRKFPCQLLRVTKRTKASLYIQERWQMNIFLKIKFGKIKLRNFLIRLWSLMFMKSQKSVKIIKSNDFMTNRFYSKMALFIYCIFTEKSCLILPWFWIRLLKKKPFYFILGYSQLTMLAQFQVDSKGTQPYTYIYPISPKLPSHPGCQSDI